jgi:hypothetical protein
MSNACLLHIDRIAIVEFEGVSARPRPEIQAMKPDREPTETPDPRDLDRLARDLGVEPVRDLRDLMCSIWPEDEDVDEFLGWLDQKRSPAHPPWGPDR